jgi:thiol-disulfide isomerase/thioredoxin
MIDILTYSCINCQRTFPYDNKWFTEYEDKGLVIIGIHTPEFAFEHDINNVTEAMKKFGIKFPIVLDNDYGTWNAYGNSYWPRKYLIDIDGYVVYDHIGEGDYDKTEQKIVDLLNERAKRLGTPAVTLGNVPVVAETSTSSMLNPQSPETYLGSARSQYEYTGAGDVPANHFSLSGTWDRTNPQYVQLSSATGSITYHFNAKKVHLVAEAASNIDADVYLDGAKITAENYGADVVNGMVTFHDARLYTLVNLKNGPSEHTLEIKVKSPGLKAYAFTFS